MEFFFQILINGLSIGFLYALTALGFVMIFKSSSVLNFSHGGLMAIGAFLFLVLSVWARLPIWLAFILTLIGDIYSYPDFLPPALTFHWGAVEVAGVYVATFIIGIIFLGLFGFFFKYSSQGIYMRSVADNQPAAMALGVHVRRVFALSWAIAALVCAMGGIVLGIMNGINVHEVSDLGIKVFPVVILGGLDSIGGAILGGIIIGLLETFTGGYISSGLREVVPYIVLIIILLIKPYGLFGLVEIERV